MVIFVVCAIAFVCCPWRYTVAKGVAFVIVLVALVVAVTMVRKYFEPRPHSKNACISNLKQIEGAKANWALEEHKTTNDTPTARDLFGKDRYIAVEPKCPHGGVYTLGKVGNPPRCSIEGHSID